MHKHSWLMLFLVASCAKVAPHGEWTAAECSNGIDDDGDDLKDCDDPDCWAFACKDADVRSIDAAVDASHPIRDAMPVDARPVPDASMPLPPPVESEDSGEPPTDDDAGPPATCHENESLCKSGEVCVAGVCKPDIWGTYTLQILSATVPAWRADGVCYDPLDDLLCGIKFCPGGCKPDPFVVVYKNKATMVYTTPTRPDTEHPTWTMEPGKAVTLASGDTLEFAVTDADPLGNSRLFSCKPDLKQLPTGMLRCTPPPTDLPDPPDAVYDITARVTKLP